MNTHRYNHTDTNHDPKGPIRVDSLKVEWLHEDSPDLSLIGEYSDQPKSPDAIDRQARGVHARGEYRYFNPAMTGETTGNPESPEQDYRRMEAYNAGQWAMIGCRAVAVVSYPCGNGSRRLETFHSGGLWGIESDSDKDYLRSVEAEQMDDLKSHLAQFGMVWPYTEGIDA